MIARLFCKCIIILIVSTIATIAQGLKTESPYIHGFHPLDDEPNEFSMLRATHPVVLTLTTKQFFDTSAIDFEKRQITFRRTDPLGYTLWEYHYAELSDYLSERKNFALKRDWKRSSLDAMSTDASKSKQNVAKLQWELPVQYPSWAQRILGNEPPKLTIDGSLKLIIGYNDNSSKDVGENPVHSGDFVLKEEYNFSVTGSVGRLISVNIKSSSENSFEFANNLQNFKIDYKEATPGELEDEIIQEVTAGYTGFDMPGSLTGIVEAKKGLFGIKIKSKFGPLMLTTIAATEQAEAASKTFNSGSGGSDPNNNKITGYLKNKFFYLDTLYRKDYIKRYGKGGNPLERIAPSVDSLEVWINSEGTSSYLASSCKHDTVYISEGDTTSLSYDSVKKTTQGYQFYRLKQNVHYKVFPDDGYIEILDSLRLSEYDQIAIYLRSKAVANGESVKKGQFLNKGSDTLRVLWTLKPRDVISKAKEDPSRYYLMWRNVYQMAVTKDLSSFKLSVKLQNKDYDTIIYEKNDSVPQQYFGAIVGLTDENGKPLTEYSNIYKGEEGLFIIPPFSNTNVNGDLPFMNPKLGSDVDSSAYTASESFRDIGYVCRFSIEGSGASKKTTFDMDYGIIVGTDKVWADGVELERDRDYAINYDMGTLELLSLKAKAAKSIKADYQLQSMFVPEKKVFLGVNGLVQLPFISDKSSIGGTLLYQDVKVNEEIPRLGQEPYSKLLFDLNTTIDLEPEWMTSLVNKLPLIETSATSKVALNIEMAHSTMNPNPDGKAYIDDFEDSKVADNLGTGDDTWFQASPPDSMLIDFHKNPPAWNSYWFSPADWDNDNRIPRNQLYVFDPKASTQAKEGYVSALRFHCTPAPKKINYKPQYVHAWAGIMTPINFSNKTKQQYLEFYIKTESKGKPGKLKIQLGVMREDLSLNGGPPNGMSNKEDTSSIPRDDYNFFLTKFDKGLDTLINADEIYLVPTENGWDTLGYDDPDLEEFRKDPARDSGEQYLEISKGNYKYKCKKENSHSLESEDINRNGTVETATKENYFQYTIDLSDTAAPYFDKDARIVRDYKWRKIRLPLKEDLPGYGYIRSQSGDPRWDNIRMARLIWTDFDSSRLSEEQTLSIAEIGFVGNQWESKVDSTGSKIEALSISNKEDTLYKPPMKVTIDQATKEAEREQALRITFKKLKKGKEVIVSKNTSYQELNFTAYKNLNLQVYGKMGPGESKGLPIHGGGLNFIFRFGTDSLTYYEYRNTIAGDWENINIDLIELAKYKDSYMVHNPDSAINTPIDPNMKVSVKAPLGRQPNLANIKWMALGVSRNSAAPGDSIDSGEIWVNEMVLSGINNMKGWSARADFQTDWADLFKFKTGMDYHNGNFRTMQNMEKTSQNSSMNVNMDASLYLDKFLPKDLGISLPVGAQIRGSVTRPQLKNSDVSLSQNGLADNLTDMGKGIVQMMSGKGISINDPEPQLYGSQSVGKTFWTSYAKNSPSKNWLLGLIPDNTTTNFTYSNSVSNTYQGKNPEGNKVYEKSDTTDTYTGTLNLDLSPKEPPAWTKWKPITDDTTMMWLPKKLRDYEFSLLPTTFKFDLADANYSSQSNIDTKRSPYSYNKKTFTLRHGFSMDYTPIAPLLKLTYDVTINRDLDTVTGKGFDTMVTQGVFKRNENETWKRMTLLYGEKSRTQRATVAFDPQLFDWLTSTVDYSSSYTGTPSKRASDPVDYVNSNVALALSFNSSLNFDNLLSMFTSAPKKNKTDSMILTFEKGFKKIGFREIRFTYAANTGLQNNYLSPSLLNGEHINSFDFFRYQIGKSKGRSVADVISGEMNDLEDFGGMRNRIGKVDKDLYEDDSRSVDRTFTFSTGLDLTFPFELSLNPISLRFSKKYVVKPDSSKLDTTISYPEFSISARSPALMKLAMVSNLFRDLSLNSMFSYSKSNHRLMLTRDTICRFDLSPLISVSGNIKKWPINFNYSHRYRNETSNQAQNNTAKVTNGDELTLSYEIEKNNRLSELKILYWTIPIKGKTTVGFKFLRERDDETSTIADKTFNLKLSINPYLTYIFTDNVTGTLVYTYSKTETTNTKDIENTFQLVIDIRFR